MNKSVQRYFLFLLLTTSLHGGAQTWVDSLDNYARTKYLPANKYCWLWTHAALLNTMVKQYDLAPAAQKQQYFYYVKKAMDKNLGVANGGTPNDVASALGLAFLYKISKEEKYKAKAEKVYNDYLKIRRTNEGGVSHLKLFTELWDDTIFMIGEFLLSMYQATGDEKYLNEFAKQFRLHREKLSDAESGLWVHGWDSNNKIHCTFCSQMNWPNKQTRRSAEKWGRGNGWIVVTLSDALDVIPKSNPLWNEMADYLKEMIVHLPELQDTATGHWFQLPLRNTDADNWIESSCTAMFAYGIQNALRLGLVNEPTYLNSVERAYKGLRAHSITAAGKKFITTKNVCVGTCIGNKHYYFKRHTKNGSPYGIGMFIQFGMRYELEKGMRKAQ